MTLFSSLYGCSLTAVSYADFHKASLQTTPFSYTKCVVKGKGDCTDSSGVVTSYDCDATFSYRNSVWSSEDDSVIVRKGLVHFVNTYARDVPQDESYQYFHDADSFEVHRNDGELVEKFNEYGLISSIKGTEAIKATIQDEPSTLTVSYDLTFSYS